MSKKIIIGFAVSLFSIFALVNSAFADFDAIYMTDTESSTSEVTTFGWDEQPWLYLDLPSSTKTYTVSWWNPVDTEIFYDTYEITSETDKVWHTLDDWFSKRKLGLWDIRADYSSAADSGTGSTDFTVTPEPLSSILFLIGGLSLAGFRYYKRKRGIAV